MNPNREEALFEFALEKPADRRAAFLDAVCAEDKALRQRIEALLAAHEQQSGFLPQDQTTTDDSPTLLDESALTEEADTHIGRYKLLEKLGEGGFGAVWAAEQREPVKRRVAFKIIKLGMDTKQVVARFEAERQALALMDHPNIAKVLDAGATDTGRPYFVMELVKGIPITKYCDQEKLDTNDRFDLFIKVCQAIQHAHQKGIIHRDIKPSNILVTLHDGVPVPKVIDFGIAKATQQELTELTIYTQHHQFIGTPAYMSPEQAEMSGLDIDTRSDIYSLGVLLYELLTGSTPFDTKELMQSGVDEMRKIIRERDPVKPSTRLSQTIAAAAEKDKGPGAQRVSHSEFDRDLDWIVMKCLEKDRSRRYDTANGLAMDIKRHLNNEPVVARPPSASYRFQKAWRRNKMAYSAGISVVAALLIGITVSVWQATVANTASREADRARIAERDQRIAAQAETERATSAEQRATASELRARQQAYAADMNLAKQAVALNNYGRARRLLERHWPTNGTPDLRGWEWRYLWQQCESDEIASLTRQANGVSDLAISPDGRLIASVAYDDTLLIQEVRGGRVLHSLKRTYAMNAVDFSPKGNVLALACSDGFIRFLHPETGIESAPPIQLEPEGIALSVAFSPTERLLAAATISEVSIWSGAPSEPVLRFRFPSTVTYGAQPGGMTFSPDERWLAVAQGNGGVDVIDLQNPNPTVKHYRNDDEETYEVAFSPDSDRLALVGWAGWIEMLQRDGDDWRKGPSWKGHDVWISQVLFMPDNERLITASADQLIKIWNWHTHEELASLKGHRDEVQAAALSPDGLSIVSGSKDGEVKVFPAKGILKGHFIKKPLLGIAAARFSPNKEFLGLLTKSNRALVFRAATLELVMDRPIEPDALCLAINNRGDQVFIGDQNGQIRLLEGSTTQPSRTFSAHDGAVFTMALSPDGNLLASTGMDQTVGVLNLTTGVESFHLADVQVADVATRGGYEHRLAISGDGTRLAIAKFDTTVDIRDIATQQRITLIPAQREVVWQAAFLNDDQEIACASSDGFVSLWGLNPLKNLGNAKGQLLGIHSVTASADGRRLAVGCGEGVVKLWSSDLANEMMTLDTGDLSIVSTVEFLPDDKTLVAVNRNGIFMWRATLLADIEDSNKSKSP